MCKFHLICENDGTGYCDLCSWDVQKTLPPTRYKMPERTELKQAVEEKMTGNIIEVMDDPIPTELDLEKPYKGLRSDSFDSVHRPSHYAEGRKYEPRKVIHDWQLNFNLGNAVKYISRAGRKGDMVEDLRKAIQYIEFEIEEIENGRTEHGN